jgi:dTDP-glucose 4,6-dehydratase
MKTILITGGAGFIGSNFVPYFLEKYREYTIVNLDKLTYAGSLGNLADVKDNPRHIFVQGDICDRPLVKSLFDRYKIDGVIHFAAESHVDNSIANPDIFAQTNVMGTLALLDAAKDFWLDAPFAPKKGCEKNRFLHISTDEVFGSLGSVGYFTETTPYAPNSPYSASKAASDIFVRSFNHTYGLNTIITNCSNNYGPKQHSEKLIPTIIRSALKGLEIPIYGDGKNVRDWLYVLDHCLGVDLAFHGGVCGETYVIGGSNEMENLTIAQTICEILDRIAPKKRGKYAKQIDENNDLAYEKSGVWFVPAFRMFQDGKLTAKLDAQGGAGVSQEELRAFLKA